MKKVLLGQNIFTRIDQKYFIKISSDYNPVHIKPLESNQINSKKQIVHGINILLTAIEFWLKKNKKKPFVVECNYIKPITINKNVKYFYFKVDKNKYSIEVEVEKSVFTKIFFDTEIKKDLNINNEIPFSNLQMIKKTKKALDYNPKKFINKTYKINFDKKNKLEKFPLIKSIFGKEICESLILISFFIGMICPGKNAIFASIKFNTNYFNKKNKFLLFMVKNFDQRFNVLDIITEGFMKTKIKAFYKIKNIDTKKKGLEHRATERPY